MKRSTVLVFLLFAILLFLGPPCENKMSTVRTDPLSGKVVDPSGTGISEVKVLSTLLSAPYTDSLDSAISSADGSYTMQRGFPNSYREYIVPACKTPSEREPIYLGVREFVLLFSHPSHDTLVAVFLNQGTYYATTTRFGRIDTTFRVDTSTFGSPGSLRTIPVITLKPRNN